jgi:hypothetical protein
MASKSKVWKYFDFLHSSDGIVDKTTTVCKICQTNLKYATGSTSSMMKHLDRKHGIEVKYLYIPATSVASERVFSTAGDLVSAQRACLESEQVDRLVFLKKNLEIDQNNNN